MFYLHFEKQQIVCTQIQQIVCTQILHERKPGAVSLPQCAICLEMNASVILIPCGHVCLCKDDAERLRRNQQLLSCPICRRAVTSTNEVFLNH